MNDRLPTTLTRAAGMHHRSRARVEPARDPGPPQSPGGLDALFFEPSAITPLCSPFPPPIALCIEHELGLMLERRRKSLGLPAGTCGASLIKTPASCFVGDRRWTCDPKGKLGVEARARELFRLVHRSELRSERLRAALPYVGWSLALLGVAIFYANCMPALLGWGHR